MLATVSPLAPEIIWFIPSQQFIKGSYRLLEGVSKGSANNGMLRSYHGFQLDNPGLGVWVLVWQTLAQHRTFMEHVAYADAVSNIMEAMIGAGEITQILLNSPSDLELALTSPITQFIYITVRPLHDRRYELLPLIGRLKEQLKMVPGCLASCWGPCIEEDTVHVGIVGWSSLHERDVAVRGRLSEIIHLIRELSDVQLRYARLALHDA